MKIINFHVVTVRRSLKIDKYYRKSEDDAKALARMNRDCYPKAIITLTKEEVTVDDKEGE